MNKLKSHVIHMQKFCFPILREKKILAQSKWGHGVGAPLFPPPPPPPFLYASASKRQLTFTQTLIRGGGSSSSMLIQSTHLKFKTAKLGVVEGYKNVLFIVVPWIVSVCKKTQLSRKKIKSTNLITKYLRQLVNCRF